MVHSIYKLIVVLSPLKQCPPDLGTPPALVVTTLRFLSSLWSGAFRVLLPDESLGITVHYQALSQYYPARLIPLPYGRKLPYTENVLCLKAGLAYSYVRQVTWGCPTAATQGICELDWKTPMKGRTTGNFFLLCESEVIDDDIFSI